MIGLDEVQGLGLGIGRLAGSWGEALGEVLLFGFAEGFALGVSTQPCLAPSWMTSRFLLDGVLKWPK